MSLATHADVKTLFSQRLMQARRMVGLSLRELSEKMDPAVSYNALHKYEAGAMLPESGVLLALASALGQTVDFFFRPITVNLAAIEFRKKSKLGSKKIEQIRESATDFFERYLQVEQALGLKTEFTNPLSDSLIKHGEDVEQAASQLRSAWMLGLAPLANVIELLEQHQIKVLVQKADPGFDGFSGWSGSIPVIVLNGEASPDRMRLTALHELGHLLMKFDPSIDEKAMEKLCHRFAGAMLMPRPVFEEEFGRSRDKVTLEELKDIKGDYGISIAATMARARDLDCISDGVYKLFCIKRSREGWREKEPGEYLGETFPNRFDQLLHRAVATEAISLSLGASLAKRPLMEFRESLQLIP
jgi:Zn-dependent peptidase ImmA (M78 family)